MRREPILRWTRRALWLVAAVCLGYWSWAELDARIYRQVEGARLERALAAAETASADPAGPERAAADEASSAPEPRTGPDRRATTRTASDRANPQTAAHDRPEPPGPPPTVLGKLEIPRIGLATLVARTSDPRSLRRAAGHVDGTALPGEGDNVGIAGHRDTAFRELRYVAPGDRVTLTTPAGTRRYVVEALGVVPAEAVEVLAPTEGETLTLITCYPFSLLGRAPDRFVVRARLAEVG